MKDIAERNSTLATIGDSSVKFIPVDKTLKCVTIQFGCHQAGLSNENVGVSTSVPTKLFLKLDPPPPVLSSAASERSLPWSFSRPHFINSRVSSSIFHYLQLLILFNELLYNCLKLSLIFLHSWVKEKSNVAEEFSKTHHLTVHIFLANKCIHAWQVLYLSGL